MAVKRLTRNEFVKMMLDQKGTTFVSINYVRPVKLKKGSDYNGTTKVSTNNLTLNINWENVVNNRREKIDRPRTFEAGQRMTGTRLVRKDGTLVPIIEYDNGNVAIEGLVNSSESEYLHNGESVQYEQLEPMMYANEKKKNNKPEAKRLGVSEDNVPILRSYRVDRIESVTINKQDYVLVD